MKLIFTFMRKNVLFAFCAAMILLPSIELGAQVCSNPTSFIYGLTSSGSIRRINVSNGATAVPITPAYPGNAPSYANALGYNNANGKFYYFKRNTYIAPQEFVSFDPATNTYTILASSPLGTSTIVNLGCVNAAGTAYYCVDAYGTLLYYNIPANTWTVITTNLLNQFGTNLTPIFNARIYGDMAMDGAGHLFIMPASATEYGLYRINAPIPTTPQGSVTAHQVIAPTSATPSGNTIGGMAFNQTGQIYVGTNTPDNRLYRLENNYTWTFLGTLGTDGIGNDLTSCLWPFGVLPVSWTGFNLNLKNHNVVLNWTVTHETNSKGFAVEHSQDGTEWESLSFIDSKAGSTSYSFIHGNPVNGRHFYRIRQEDIDGGKNYSELKTINITTNSEISVGPNPTKDVIRIVLRTIGNESPKARIIDLSGRVLREINLKAGSNIVDIKSFPIGAYMVRVQLSNGEVINQRVVKAG